MVALDFLLKGGRRPKIIHFNHQTEHGYEAEKFIRRRCVELSLDLTVETLASSRPAGVSEEEYWRNERYNVFNSLNEHVITVHHLDDAVEWWLFSSMHGTPKLISIRNKNVIRPFLLTKKESIRDWAIRHNVKYIEDPSNESRKHSRNIIRHDILPHALKVNPGLYKVVARKYQQRASAAATSIAAE
jgi:tRNA(Ile)-lysidine synthase